ncbi:polyamine aminopropyltransferase [Thermovenabulum gondwanense]|uniref:Polyamine aminopropyltransferase n=1 Tax=Thermovenabulum gondwanense TaxID=520767 RepID=A0A161Q9U1_9FIRM|nr:polyamine aminopropyltransferase [Thermovenabulum gondwanense]KYO64538.1 Polyamine aminopropyltransferase [Thermovenabulum gondwanense]
MEFWFSEYQSKNVKMSYRIRMQLHREKTKFQELAVFDSEDCGRMLILDDVVQLTMKDEFVYHEMMSHVPLFTHGNAKKVLVIGGGDGGTLREILKHPVEEAHLVEIDEGVIEAAKNYFPELSVAFKDERAKIFCEDGIAFIKDKKNFYDIIIIDSTDPIGPAVGLFAKEFYNNVYEALTEDGIFVAQTESPFFFSELLKRIYKDVSSIFKYTNVYIATIPTYPGALWTFTMGSKKINPLERTVDKIDFDTKYYTPEIHKAAFVLPAFVKKIISG